jgi:uncharacterized protein YqjF (DUF2071 family)
MSEEPSRKRGERVFLSAEWRDLVMLNYEVDPRLLQGYIPPGTELDVFDGRTFISLVGFRFLRTKLFGALFLPFHTNFDEVNLRFYVRRRENGEVRRGVVFIREIVPQTGIAVVARLVYGEKYSSYPMRHSVSMSASGGVARYEFRLGGAWCGLEAQVSGTPAQPAEGSLEQFITEHYWGYSARRGGGCLEYHVSHVPWGVWISKAAGFRGNADALYGPELGAVVRRPPDSAFIADGSPVLVFSGTRIS